MSKTIQELEEKVKRAYFCGATALIAGALSTMNLVCDTIENAPKVTKNEEGKNVVQPTAKQAGNMAMMAFSTALAFCFGSSAYKRKKEIEQLKAEEGKTGENKAEITAAMMAKKQNAR